MTSDRKTGPADAFTGPIPMPRFLSFLGTPRSEKASSETERAKASYEVTSIVAKHFHVLGSAHDQAGVYTKVIMDPDDDGKDFESVRLALKRVRMFPRLLDNGKETVIAVFPLPPRKEGKVTANLVMLVLTVFTTVWAGSIIWLSRTQESLTAIDMVTVLFSPVDLFLGALTFAFPLLLILGTHELGHYFMSRKYRIDATLPYFIPVPPFISPFGTFGALISMKDPITNRKALIDIGAAGPIAGFIIAVPVTLLGLVLTGTFPAESALVEGETYMVINPPLLFNALSFLTGGSGDSMLFPTALAGWIGLFVTALNLFPVGQLDGGHIARGVLGDKAKYLSYATIAVMIVLGFITSFGTYLFFAILILFMGGRHPPPLDDVTRIKPKQLLVAGASLMIMVLTFHPVPIQTYTHENVDISFSDVQLHQFVSQGQPNLIELEVMNGGERDMSIRIEVWLNGTKATESLTQDRFGWDERAFEPFVGLSHSSFGQNGFRLLMMRSTLLTAKGGAGTPFPLVVGCSSDVPMGSSMKVELKAVKDGDVMASTELILSRSGLDLHLSHVTLNGSVYEVSGIVSLLEGAMDTTELRVEQVVGEAVISIQFKGHPSNCTWVQPATGNWTTVNITGGRTVLGKFDWASDVLRPEVRFQLRVEAPSGDGSSAFDVSLKMAGRPAYSRTLTLI